MTFDNPRHELRTQWLAAVSRNRWSAECLFGSPPFVLIIVANQPQGASPGLFSLNRG